MTDQLTVHARVRLVVDVHLSQPWSATETAETIQRVAARQATEILDNALKGRANFVQPPTVYMVIANKEEVTP